MAATRAEQVAFGWAGEGTPETTERPASEARPSTPRPLRGRYARGERKTEKAAPPATMAPLPPDNELWDVHAAARFLKRSVSWVYHRAEDGTLPVKRSGGWGLRFIPADLRAWVEASGEPRRRAARSSKE
jgi:predicted DNA-binding transcriptional regulator AlpA